MDNSATFTDDPNSEPSNAPSQHLSNPSAAESSRAESTRRELFAKKTIASKIEEDIKNGYIERVDAKEVIKANEMDPELRAERPLTEKEAAWLKRKQARRAGPPSSSWPSNMPTHNQNTEFIRFTEKTHNLLHDPHAPKCSECGSRLRGTSIVKPLSRPADSRPSALSVDDNAPLCFGCSRLFACVKDHKEKLEMIDWILTHKTSSTVAPNDEELMKLCESHVVKMKALAHDHYSELPDNFVTAQQLFDRVKYNNYNCNMVGSPMCLEPERFNSLSFDHVFPLPKSMMRGDCWSINNLQPIAHCLHYVKGNEADKEVRRWLLQFILYNNSR